MHAIRTAARQTAWKYYDGESRNYNPFARTARNGFRRPEDEEEALQHARTAESVPTQVEEDRKDQNRQMYPPPGRAGTAPPTRTSIEPHPASASRSDPFSYDKEQDYTNSPVSEDIQARSSDPSRNTESTLAAEPSNADAKMNDHETSGIGAKKRRKFVDKLHFGKKDKDEVPVDGEEKKKRRKHIGFMPQLKATLFGSWINVLLVCVPVGIAIHFAGLNGKAEFVVNFIAIIPLAAMLSYATEELAMYVGETLGGLLNASFGNATELIVGVIALAKGEILIVQTSLIGSMLSNLLLVLGMCFFFGGVNRVKQHFNITVAQTASSLLALSIGSLIIPTAFYKFGTDTSSAKTQAGVGPISRGTAIILLLVYGSYLFFQLKTHTDMYNEPSEKVEKRSGATVEKGATLLGIARMGAGGAASAGGQVNQANLVHKPDDEEEEDSPSLTVIGALVTLTISTVLIALASEFMVDGIGAITEGGAVSQEFVGLILIPIVGNAAEHATAVTVAIKDKMDLAIGVAVGSSMQIALLVLPLMVVIGWCGAGAPAEMTLNFDGFQVAVLFIAVLLVNYLIQDGESHWLEGVLLMATYIIIAVTAWFYPANGNVAG